MTMVDCRDRLIEVGTILATTIAVADEPEHNVSHESGQLITPSQRLWKKELAHARHGRRRRLSRIRHSPRR